MTGGRIAHIAEKPAEVHEARMNRTTKPGSKEIKLEEKMPQASRRAPQATDMAAAAVGLDVMRYRLCATCARMAAERRGVIQ